MSGGLGITIEVATRAGRPVLVKTALDAVAESRLRGEAERLRVARHPGVVELVEETAEPVRLVLGWAGDRTLETARPNFEAAAALLACLASTVADLHDLGVIHGRIEPGHVVVDPSNRPRLCGLAWCDSDGDEPQPADDVDSLGRLIDLMLGDVTELEPIPNRRWGRRRWTGFQRRALLMLADHATDPDPSRRPTARSLARSIGEAVPGARLSPAITDGPPEADGSRAVDPIDDLGWAFDPPAGPPESEPDAVAGPEQVDPCDPGDEGSGLPRVDPPFRLHPGSRRDRRKHRDRRRGRHAADCPSPRGAGIRRIVAALGVAVILVAVAVGTGRRATDPRSGRALVAASPGSPIASSTEPRVGTGRGSTPGSANPTARRCPAPPAEPRADVDGDGCPEPVRVEGTVIQAGSARFAVGTKGDRIAVGDWDCDGTATPAIVRPSTGEVFVFTRWAGPGAAVTVARTATVPDAVGPVAPSGRCGLLVVRKQTGATVVVPAPGRPS